MAYWKCPDCGLELTQREVMCADTLHDCAPASQPDPKDARIAELEAAAEERGEEFTKLYTERDQLRARVAELEAQHERLAMMYSPDRKRFRAYVEQMEKDGHLLHPSEMLAHLTECDSLRAKLARQALADTDAGTRAPRTKSGFWFCPECECVRKDDEPHRCPWVQGGETPGGVGS